jgi:WD40 repeat protein
MLMMFSSRRATSCGPVVLLVLGLTGGGIALCQAHSTPTQRSPLAVLTGHTTFVTSVAFSPDGHTLASGSFDQTDSTAVERPTSTTDACSVGQISSPG